VARFALPFTYLLTPDDIAAALSVITAMHWIPVKLASSWPDSQTRMKKNTPARSLRFDRLEQPSRY
jgi:hypothetical protein